MKGQTIAIVAAIAIALYLVFSKSSTLTPIGGVTAQPTALGNLIPFESSLAQSFGALFASKPAPVSNSATVGPTSSTAGYATYNPSPLPSNVAPLPQGTLSTGDLVPGYSLSPSGAPTYGTTGPTLEQAGYSAPGVPLVTGTTGPTLAQAGYSSPGVPLDSVTPVIPVSMDDSSFIGF